MANKNNTKQYQTIVGSDPNGDDIYNSGAFTKISLGAGNNTVDNSASNVFIRTKGGDDAISNRNTTYTPNSYVTIEAGAGNDTVVSRSGRSLIKTESGEDRIRLIGGSYVSVYAGTGNDIITVGAGRSYINGGADDDVIILRSNSCTTNGGKGNDSIVGSIYKDYFVYTINEGNDTLSGVTNNDFLKINFKKRAIRRWSGNNLVSETLQSYLTDDLAKIKKNTKTVGADLVIKIGSGSLIIQDAIGKEIKLVDDKGDTAVLKWNDYINTNIDSNLIIPENNGIGDDYIKNGYESGYNHGSKVTIQAGAGKDTIDNKGNSVHIDAGEGNDFVRDYGSDTTIFAAEGRDTLRLNGHSSYDGTVYGGALIHGGEGSDYITNNYGGHHSTISGDGDSDTIINGASVVAIDGGDGNDHIYNNSGGIFSTIIGGAGNDIIRNFGHDILIEAGDGNDTILTTNSSITLNAGKGDDVVKLGDAAHIINYSAGDGDDTIFGYKKSDTISLIGGASITYESIIGADKILKIGDGSIRLINAKYHEMTIMKEEATVKGYNATYPEGIVTVDAVQTSVKVDKPFEGIFDLTHYVNVKDVDARDCDCSVVLIANHRGNRFYAGSGGGTIIGGTANDYLYASTGKDEFVYRRDTIGGYLVDTVIGGVHQTIRTGMSTIGGNDYIYNYEPGQDTIILSDVTVSKVNVVNSDVILKFKDITNPQKTDGSLRIKNSKGKELTITDASGTTKTYTFSTSNPNGLESSTAAFIERNYLEEILIEDKVKGYYNGKQSVCISGTTYEWKSNNDFTVNEYGGSLRPYVHD